MNNSVVGAAAQLITTSKSRRTAPAAEPYFAGQSSVGHSDYANALSRHGQQAQPAAAAAVYLHIPFCSSRCLSCDHNATVTHDVATIDGYIDTLEQELRLVTDRIGTTRTVRQLHVGGGSPNYLADRQLVRLAELIETHFSAVADAEISIEANPSRATPSQLELLAGLGFRDIQFEVRDLDQNVQRAIGRSHSLALLKDVFGNAREAGFRTVGMDLLYGLPGQTQASIQKTVEQLIGLAPDRVSCYSYSRRPEVFPHQRALDPESMPSLGDKLALFNGIAEGLEAAGYVWVGLDCFVRASDQLAAAQSEGRLRRNWIGYTAHESNDFFGFGTNAISELDGLCVQNHLEVPQWQAAVKAGELPVRGGVRLSESQRARREAMTQLMCNMQLADYSALLEIDDASPRSIADYEREGLVKISPRGVAVTEQGRFVLHHLWGDISPRHRWDGVW
jgi:oxygen-independent coproporphyrinogen-3 oxidase